jgi:tRNA G46 methylase TrmB
MSAANHSRKVHSSQAGIHPRLQELLVRYRTAGWRNPLHAPTVEAFDALKSLLRGNHLPLVLDSGCGTGESTYQLSRAHPGHLVIGVDKSAERLSRTGAKCFPHRDGNVLWVRAELASFWRLALQDGWRLDRHYLLYPNPWPKPGQLQRRWHAHPVFEDMLRLGGRVEMRTNWRIYAEEFAFAASFLRGTVVAPAPVPDSDPLTPFERKYRASNHELYAVVLPDQSSRVN